MRTQGALTWVAGPHPTEEDPCPKGMVFTYTTTGGTTYMQVDPVTKQSRGHAQFFRTEARDSDGNVPVTPVWRDGSGQYLAKNEIPKPPRPEFAAPLSGKDERLMRLIATMDGRRNFPFLFTRPKWVGNELSS